MSPAATQSAPRYDRLNFVLGQGDRGEAAIVKNALDTRGIHRVTECNGSADRLFNALDAAIIDAVVYDFDLLNDRFVDAMQHIRRKARGRNPFVVIVATVADADGETARRLGRAGVDDMIRRPVTGQRLFESVDNLMQRRKPFMVAHDYVGPIRQANLSNVIPFRVPNTLRSRAIEGVEEDELERIVNDAVVTLRDRQLVACGVEVDSLARQFCGDYGSLKKAPERADELRKTLARLEQATEELRERCRGTRAERVGDLAKMLLALTQRMARGSVGRASTEVQLVSKLAEAIRVALTVERESAQAIRDIAATVADFTGER